jgi:hypothetical protein
MTKKLYEFYNSKIEFFSSENAGLDISSWTYMKDFQALGKDSNPSKRPFDSSKHRLS